MSFWSTSDNKPIDATGSFEAGASIEPLPDGTSVLAAPVEAAWKTYDFEDYIKIQWSVLAPAEYKNRRVFQKIKVHDKDKGDKAKRMLAAIDANAGGKLIALGKEPTDQDLTQHLVGKPMMLKLGLWEMDTDNGKRSGNWVIAVSPKGGAAPAQAAAPAPAPGGIENDDIPF